MTRAGLALATIVLAATAAAQQAGWQVLEYPNRAKGAIYLDPATVQGDTLRRANILLNESKQMFADINLSKPYMSVVLTVVGDCAGHTMGTERRAYYAGQFAGGRETLVDVDVTNPALTPVGDNKLSLNNQLLASICSAASRGPLVDKAAARAAAAAAAAAAAEVPRYPPREGREGVKVFGIELGAPIGIAPCTGASVTCYIDEGHTYSVYKSLLETYKSSHRVEQDDRLKRDEVIGIRFVDEDTPGFVIPQCLDGGCGFARPSLVLKLLNHNVESIYFSIKAGALDTATTAFTARFGAGLSLPFKMQNTAGAEWEAVEKRWQTREVEAVISCTDFKSQECGGYISTQTWRDAAQAKKRAQEQKGTQF